MTGQTTTAERSSWGPELRLRGAFGHQRPTPRTRDEVAAQLEDELLIADPAPGTRLPSERKLAETLAVSRPLLREALRTLAARGLIQVIPGRGAYVRSASDGYATQPLQILYYRRQVTPRDLLEARLMLEPTAVELACQRATDDEVSALASAIENFDGAAGVLEKARWDVAAHTCIARMSHNPVLDATFSSVAPLILAQLIRSLTDRDVLRLSGPIHHEIVDAIRARDAHAGRNAMVRHLEVAEQTYGADFDESLDVLARRELQKLFGSSAALESILDGIRLPEKLFPSDSLERERRP